MQIDKETVLDLLREQGKSDEAEQASRELPNQIDPDRDAGLLQRSGIRPEELLSRFTGGATSRGSRRDPEEAGGT